jgi:hypothetical protein
MVDHDMLPTSPLAAGGAPLVVQKLLENATGRCRNLFEQRLASSIDAALRGSFVA